MKEVRGQTKHMRGTVRDVQGENAARVIRRSVTDVSLRRLLKRDETSASSGETSAARQPTTPEPVPPAHQPPPNQPLSSPLPHACLPSILSTHL